VTLPTPERAETGYEWSAAPPRRKRRKLWVGPVVGLILAVAVAALGIPLGALWSAIAPHIPATMTDQGPIYADPEGEQPVGGEGTYVFLTLGAGIVLAILAWIVLRRYRGVAVLLGLALGGVGAGVVTWLFGHAIGRTSAPIGTTFPAAVRLRVAHLGLWHHWLPYARGDVLFLALAAVLMYILLAGFSAYPSLRRPDESVWAVGDGELGQRYGYGPDPAQESDLPAEQRPFGA
jgi:hypothetical protein